MKRTTFLPPLFLALILSSCTTNFIGSAYVQGGVQGCQKKCNSWGLEFVGMVSMGEYSDGCICKKHGINQSALDGSSVGAAVAGVEMQRQAADRMQQAAAGQR